MKIGCYCGATIYDQTDDLPHKARLFPDQDWNWKWNALDEQVFVPFSTGQTDADAASWECLRLLGTSCRLMYQCTVCGRLYINDHEGKLHCYVPAEPTTSKEILRGQVRPE